MHNIPSSKGPLDFTEIHAEFQMTMNLISTCGPNMFHILNDANPYL